MLKIAVYGGDEIKNYRLSSIVMILIERNLAKQDEADIIICDNSKIALEIRKKYPEKGIIIFSKTNPHLVPENCRWIPTYNVFFAKNEFDIIIDMDTLSQFFQNCNLHHPQQIRESEPVMA